MPELRTPDERLVFAVAPAEEEGAPPVIMVALSRGARDYIADERTQFFDLSPIGIPFRMMLFGTETRARAIEIISEANRARGFETEFSEASHDGIFGDPAAGLAIWWLTVQDCDACERLGRGTAEWPDYIRVEFEALQTRYTKNVAGGHLWVPPHLADDFAACFENVPDSRPHIGSADGIVVQRLDVPRIFSWPGFLTGLDCKPLNSVRRL